MKRFATLCLAFCVLLSGCDMREISDELYAIILGIDRLEDGVCLTLAVPLYQSTEEYKTEVIKVKSKDVASGLEKLKTVRARKISLMHLKAVVISEEVSEAGLEEYISAVKNHPETANAMGIMISKNDASETVSEFCHNTSGEISSEIEEFLLSGKYNPYCPVVRFDEFYNNINSLYCSPYAYLAGKNGEFDGIAVFDGDKKTGTLSIYESAHIMIAKGEMNGGYVEYETRSGTVKISLFSKKSKIIVGDSVKIDVELIGKPEYPYGVSEIRDELVQNIKAGIKTAVLKSYSSGCDILGLNGFAAKNYATIGEWKKNKPDFDNISVSVKLKISTSVNG